jgi:hypothetical protein
MTTDTQKTRIARINRRLAKRYEKLRSSRSSAELQNLGDRYVVDMYTNTVIQTHVDLDEFEAQVLQAA